MHQLSPPDTRGGSRKSRTRDAYSTQGRTARDSRADFLECGAHLSSAAQTMVYFHLDASSLC
jgi:hypothetical protein